MVSTNLVQCGHPHLQRCSLLFTWSIIASLCARFSIRTIRTTFQIYKLFANSGKLKLSLFNSEPVSTFVYVSAAAGFEHHWLLIDLLICKTRWTIVTDSFRIFRLIAVYPARKERRSSISVKCRKATRLASHAMIFFSWTPTTALLFRYRSFMMLLMKVTQFKELKIRTWI